MFFASRFQIVQRWCGFHFCSSTVCKRFISQLNNWNKNLILVRYDLVLSIPKSLIQLNLASVKFLVSSLDQVCIGTFKTKNKCRPTRTISRSHRPCAAITTRAHFPRTSFLKTQRWALRISAIASPLHLIYQVVAAGPVRVPESRCRPATPPDDPRLNQ